MQVELYQGAIDANGDIVNAIPVVMDYQGQDTRKLSVYTARYHLYYLWFARLVFAGVTTNINTF